jgi:hypothetical protein
MGITVGKGESSEEGDWGYTSLYCCCQKEEAYLLMLSLSKRERWKYSMYCWLPSKRERGEGVDPHAIAIKKGERRGGCSLYCHHRKEREKRVSEPSLLSLGVVC